jgi:hypothetical protein
MDESEQREIQDQEQAYQEQMQFEDMQREEQEHTRMMEMYTYDEGGFSDGFTKY